MIHNGSSLSVATGNNHLSSKPILMESLLDGYTCQGFVLQATGHNFPLNAFPCIRYRTFGFLGKRRWMVVRTGISFLCIVSHMAHPCQKCRDFLEGELGWSAAMRSPFMAKVRKMIDEMKKAGTG
jgi:hypothetical protein